MAGKYILVTGAYGFLGTVIVNKLISENENIVLLGLTNTDEIYDKQDKQKINYYGLVNRENLAKIKEDIYAIVHCAGASGVGIVEKNAITAFNNTVLSTHELLEEMRYKFNNCRMIYISSAAVYGDTGKNPVTEAADLNPISLYGEHKKIAETLCNYYKKQYALKIDIVRPFSICGKGLQKQLIWDACNKFNRGESLFYGTGDELRDWVGAEDIAEMIYLILKQEKYGEIFNACNGVGIKNRLILEYLAENFDKSINVKFNDISNNHDPFNLVGSNDKAKLLLGWKPKYNCQDIIKEYVNWYKGEYL